jgi:uncharacterized membrane protein YeaQ/YmgE (transglycosylase-associated protein family)
MDRKKIIMFAMIVGSSLGGWVATLFGAGALSYWCMLGCVVGGILSIWIAFRLTSP